MKLLKTIFYSICILILLGCGAVLVCALNPSLTGKLSAMVQDSQKTKEDDEENSFSVEIKPPVQDYVAPPQSEVTLPSQVNGLVGYVPVSAQEFQVSDAVGRELQDSLQTGPHGEDLTFDASIYPYYSMLSDEMKKLYCQIYANALELKESFAPVITFQSSQLKDVFEAVYNDHPELFWLETEYSCKYLQTGQCIEIILKYNEAAKDITESKRRFEKQAHELLAEAMKRSDSREQERYVHDRLLMLVQYREDAKMAQSAYSALVNGESVCAGYARAFQYILQQLGIPCYYCTGYSGEDHAWNIVKLDDKYVNVDVTWADTNPITYDYYNKTDEAFAATHVRTGLAVRLPACTDDGVYEGDDVVADSTMAEPESTTSPYINPDPTEPLSWPMDAYNVYTDEHKAELQKQENLKKAGVREEEVMETMAEYYKDCLGQMVEKGAGMQTFTNVVPKSLWSSIELDYSDEDYKKGYVEEALKKLKKDNFAIQLQVEDLSGGYYRLYHHISTW